MTREPATQQLAEALDALVKRKGIELPSIPDDAGRRAYLRFLRSRGYDEEQLLPVIDRGAVSPQMKGALLVGLLQALDSDDRDFVKAVVWMAHNTMIGRDNTNLIIHGLAESLVADFRAAGIRVPAFYPGVFPTDSYNAQCTPFDGWDLVLIDTGCMEMAEAIVVAMLSKGPPTEKVEDIVSAVDGYLQQGRRADPKKVGSRGIAFGSGLPAMLVNAFEGYVLAHEMGHLALGHTTDHPLRKQRPRAGAPIDVVEKSHFQEFQADLWACRALIERARCQAKTDSDVPIAIGGITMGVGVALLVDASAKKHGMTLSGGHPPAHERLYMVQTAYELLGVHDEAFIARRFDELLQRVVEDRYPASELPPMLDRELNRKLMAVLDSLGIDYSGAPYIHRFA